MGKPLPVPCSTYCHARALLTERDDLARRLAEAEEVRDDFHKAWAEENQRADKAEAELAACRAECDAGLEERAYAATLFLAKVEQLEDELAAAQARIAELEATPVYANVAELQRSRDGWREMADAERRGAADLFRQNLALREALEQIIATCPDTSLAGRTMRDIAITALGGTPDAWP